MGYTQFDIDLVEKYLHNVKSVLDFGSQNDYSTGLEKPPFISEWYKLKRIDYTCIDLAGDNNSLKLDLSEVLPTPVKFDLVCDIGTSEHCVQMNEYESIPFQDGYINSIYPKGEIKSIEQGYYNCWLNKHNLCKVGGLIISENPLTGHWPEHGYSYLTESFYKELESFTDFEILELGRNAGSGNYETGMNVYCVIKKHGDKFPVFELFKHLSYFVK